MKLGEDDSWLGRETTDVLEVITKSPYHFVSRFGQVDLHVHGVRRGIHHLFFLFLEALRHCLDGFGPFFPARDAGRRTDYISPFSTMRARQPNHVIVFLSTGRQFQEWALPKSQWTLRWCAAMIKCTYFVHASTFKWLLNCAEPFEQEEDTFAPHLPLLGGLHVEGALDDSGPLQAADDECVGLGPLRLHQLALWPQPGRVRREMKRSVQERDKLRVIAIYLYLHSSRHRSVSLEKNRCLCADYSCNPFWKHLYL